MRHKFSVSLTLALVLAMLVTAVAMADNLQTDADGLAPIANNTTIAFGNVCAGQTYTQNVIFAARRNGNYGQPQVWANSATITVAAGTITGNGLSASMGDDTITLPSDWNDTDNNELSTDTALATITLVPVATGTGSVPFSGSGDGSGGGGGTTTRSETINVSWTVIDCSPADTTPPVIIPSVVGMLGNNGWYTSDVTVSWSVVDNESTVTSMSGCDPTTIDYDTTGVTLTCEATSAGGTSSESVTIKRDATDPEVSLVGGPTDGSSHYFGFVPAAPTCDASDATSGLAGACSVSGYGDTVGNHTVTTSAFDNAGNEGTDSASYTVLAWTLNGFYRPVEMDGVWNTVKGGSTVPLKFNVFAGATELTDVGVVKFTAVKVVCEVGGDEEPVGFTTTGGTSLRYDWTDGQFIQNWKTPKSTGCYRVTMTTDDSSSLVAFFKLK